MSKTNHPRIPGTHRVLTKAQRTDPDWAGELVKTFRQRAEGKAEVREALTEVTMAARLDWDEPAKAVYGLTPVPLECYDAGDFGLTHEGRLEVLGEQLADADLSWRDEEPLAAWEYDILNFEGTSGVTFGEYLSEHERRNANVPEVVWSSESVDIEERAWLENRREVEVMREADYDYAYDRPADVADDEDFDRFEDNSAWLPLVTLYDPSGAYEDCYDVFGGDGFIVEGPTRSGRPEGRKSDRDEWTVASLARAWDIETSAMIAYLQDPAMGNESGLTPSSRVPMHLISDRMERETCPIAPNYTRMHLFRCLVLAHTDGSMSRKVGAAARRPDAKRRLAEAGRSLERTIRDERRGYNPWGQPVEPIRAVQMATPRGFRPYWAPRPGSNPFLGVR